MRKFSRYISVFSLPFGEMPSVLGRAYAKYAAAKPIHRNLLVLALFLATAVTPTLASAQVALDASGVNGGSIVVGYDSRACDPSIVGAIRYNSSTNTIQNCMPTSVNSCPNIGDVCSDGTVYAGISPDGSIVMYTTAADEGGFAWNNGNTSGTTITSQTSTTTGATNTANLITIDSDSGVGGTQPHLAAQQCANSTANGHSDWYLPAKDELNVLYTNKTAIGGFNISGSFPAGDYWSSTESNDSYAWYNRFSDGSQYDDTKYFGFSVRCVRKSSTPPPVCIWTKWGG